jgi:hypothetical protein
MTKFYTGQDDRHPYSQHSIRTMVERVAACQIYQYESPLNDLFRFRAYYFLVLYSAVEDGLTSQSCNLEYVRKVSVTTRIISGKHTNKKRSVAFERLNSVSFVQIVLPISEEESGGTIVESKKKKNNRPTHWLATDAWTDRSGGTDHSS